MTSEKALLTHRALNKIAAEDILFLYAPAIRRMVERAYSVTPVHPSVCLRPRPALAICVCFSGGSIRVLWTHF